MDNAQSPSQGPAIITHRTDAVDKVVLRKGRDERVRRGHPWVFSGEVNRIPGADMDGQVIVVEDEHGRFMGVGLCNTKSNILVRLVSRMREPVGRSFFQRRLAEALQMRQRVHAIPTGPDSAYRLVHAEADGMPAFVVDRYADHLVVQVLSLGMAQRLPMLTDLLVELTGVKGIYERSDAPVRALEGLPQTSGVLWGEAPPEGLTIDEDGAKFIVDLIGGQKTGFFLDQRLNRGRVRELAKDMRVLNAFSYTGGFSIAAALGGAKEVVSIDISTDAIALAEKNAELNGVADRCTWMATNAFDTLREMERAGEKFDMIILDPPAFTKNKDSIPGAMRGYKEINLRAMRMLPPGGLLVTSSCSHHISPAMFATIVADAGADTKRRVRQLELRGPSPDHPVMPAAPETDYLKCLIAEVR